MSQLEDRVLRINVVTKPGEYSLDDASPEKIDRLINLGRAEAVKKANLEPARARFLSQPAEAFVPIHPVTPASGAP